MVKVWGAMVAVLMALSLLAAEAQAGPTGAYANARCSAVIYRPIGPNLYLNQTRWELEVVAPPGWTPNGPVFTSQGAAGAEQTDQRFVITNPYNGWTETHFFFTVTPSTGGGNWSANWHWNTNTADRQSASGYDGDCLDQVYL